MIKMPVGAGKHQDHSQQIEIACCCEHSLLCVTSEGRKPEVVWTVKTTAPSVFIGINVFKIIFKTS